VRGTPALVFACGLLAAGYGAVLLAMAAKEEGVPELAVPVIGLGLALVGMGVYAARRPPPAPSDLPPAPPGRWILVALGVIVAAQLVWVAYWMRHH
jgi:hypothetical protein